MSDYLTEHALRNVWCTPNQDNQLILQPHRITPINGVWGSYRVMWSQIALPEPSAQFHLYHIGQISAPLLNLFSRGTEWITLAEACITGKNICDVYVTSGVQIPRTQTWYRTTIEGSVLLAVKKNALLPYDFNTLEVFLRVYSNEYFSSVRAGGAASVVDVQGGVMADSAAVLALKAKFDVVKYKTGGTYCFVNGMKVGAINLATVRAGDVAEFVYDASITRVVDFAVAGLPTFDSTLDRKGKYLLHYAGAASEGIDYLDDIDLFLVHQTTQKGVYVHKNAADTLRMLTHRDYAIPVAYLSAYFSIFSEDGAIPLEQLYLRMHIRKSGYERALVDESHHIAQLYMLPEECIPRALLGVDSNVAVWRAPALEASAYTQIMRSECCTITPALVQRAYGYSAITALVAQTPCAVVSVAGVRQVPVPYYLASGATAFEYDANGLLLDWQVHTGGTVYVCQDASAALVEMLAGTGGHALDEYFDQSTVASDPALAYRYYSAPVVGGVPSDQWRDASAQTDHALTATGVSWPTPTGEHTLIRSDKQFLLYAQDVDASDGVLLFTLSSQQVHAGVSAWLPLQVPLGELDIFVNGFSLIQGLDYVVKFPHVVVLNKAYLVSPGSQAQKVVVRFCGFCSSALAPTALSEHGFVQYGRLSVNHRFDIHPGRVLRTVMDGRLRLPATLAYSETGGTYDMFSADNGKSYSIRDIVVPLRSLSDTDTYAYRAEALATERAISDFMSLVMPQTLNEPTSVNPIAQRIALCSPFIAAVLHALVGNVFSSEALSVPCDDDAVRTACAPYLYLFDYDPLHPDYPLDLDYVQVHPHLLATEVNLDLPRWRFLNRVVKLYARGRVSLTSFVKLV